MCGLDFRVWSEVFDQVHFAAIAAFFGSIWLGARYFHREVVNAHGLLAE